MKTGSIVISGIAIINGGWMVVDGVRSLITGHYFTPNGRPGKLGPWSFLVQAIGLDPYSILVKAVIALIGAAWLIGLALFWTGQDDRFTVMSVVAVFSLWYLPVGTALSIICLLLIYLV